MVAAIREEATERIVAVGRFDVVSPDAAEFALVVRDDYQGIGLGTALFRCLADIATRRDIGVLTGIVLPENTVMLHLAERQGAQRVHHDRSDGVVEKRLRTASGDAEKALHPGTRPVNGQTPALQSATGANPGGLSRAYAARARGGVA